MAWRLPGPFETSHRFLDPETEWYTGCRTGVGVDIFLFQGGGLGKTKVNSLDFEPRGEKTEKQTPGIKQAFVQENR